jgi:hypothetical protein
MVVVVVRGRGLGIDVIGYRLVLIRERGDL